MKSPACPTNAAENLRITLTLPICPLCVSIFYAVHVEKCIQKPIKNDYQISIFRLWEFFALRKTLSMAAKKLLGVVLFMGFHAVNAQVPYFDKSRDGFLVFHPIRTDQDGLILPWCDDEPGKAYDSVITLVWNFWDTMRTDINGLPYYMNHQVWRPGANDPRGLGGDQLAMALSSWHLLYQYSGSERVKENMKFIADYYLTHALSPKDAVWPSIPFPYNNLIYSGYYQGDMVIGKDFTQPDKAGSFGDELVTLYKITGNTIYLDAAVEIANTLAKHVKAGNENESPLPFKVNAFTGEVGRLKSNRGSSADEGFSSYTSNWVGTLQLWMKLRQLNRGDVALYQKAFDTVLAWMKTYPLKTNKWGPFFEDIPGWSDTQINAVTFARFMMENQELFPDRKNDVKRIFDWVCEELGNDQWEQYGVTVVNEQTVYQTPGNSHTSRQAAAEILYAGITGELAGVPQAIRKLNWATYMVDKDGKNCYPRDEVWLTDGYGDYVRHYLRAMAAMPSLAPSDENHIVHSTSVVRQADYAPDFNKRLSPDVRPEELDKVYVFYKTFDKESTETLRMVAKPSQVKSGNEILPFREDLSAPGWTWEPLDKGGILSVRHSASDTITIYR